MSRGLATAWSVVACVVAPLTLAGLVLRPLQSAQQPPPAAATQVTDNPAAAADAADAADADEPTIDPLSVNANCYVCHTTFVREEISKWHFAEQITCVSCHGLSAAHANDENIGATKPDITYRRDQIDAMCSKECHTQHDVPAGEVLARFQERKPAASPVVCTDCHGHHRIEL